MVSRAVANNFQVSTLVRNKSKFEELFTPDILSKVKVIESDVTNRENLENAIKGHNAIVNCALTALDGERSTELIKTICELSESHLESPKRVWALGGMAALDVNELGIQSISKFYTNFQHFR